MGLIFPLGLTFLSPSATMVSPGINPEITSTFPLFLNPILISVLFAVLSFDILYTYALFPSSIILVSGILNELLSL